MGLKRVQRFPFCILTLLPTRPSPGKATMPPGEGSRFTWTHEEKTSGPPRRSQRERKPPKTLEAYVGVHGVPSPPLDESAPPVVPETGLQTGRKRTFSERATDEVVRAVKLYPLKTTVLPQSTSTEICFTFLRSCARLTWVGTSPYGTHTFSFVPVGVSSCQFGQR